MFTTVMRTHPPRSAVWLAICKKVGSVREYPMADMYLADANQVAEASDLIARFGEQAMMAATEQAGRSRAIGNHVHFCRWRQTARLIELMSSGAVVGTVH